MWKASTGVSLRETLLVTHTTEDGFCLHSVSSLLFYTITYIKYRTEKGQQQKNIFAKPAVSLLWVTACLQITTTKKLQRMLHHFVSVEDTWQAFFFFFFLVCFFLRNSWKKKKILPRINAQTHAPNIPVNVHMLPRCELINVVWFIRLCFLFYKLGEFLTLVIFWFIFF